jgi:hypothetical protein
MSRPFVEVGLCEDEDAAVDARPLGELMKAARLMRRGGGDSVGRPAAGISRMLQLSSYDMLVATNGLSYLSSCLPCPAVHAIPCQDLDQAQPLRYLGQKV